MGRESDEKNFINLGSHEINIAINYVKICIEFIMSMTKWYNLNLQVKY